MNVLVLNLGKYSVNQFAVWNSLKPQEKTQIDFHFMRMWWKSHVRTTAEDISINNPFADQPSSK